MPWQLVVLRGRRKGLAIPITGPFFWIGRGLECQVRPTSPTVSRRHCGLMIRNGQLFVADCHTANGTIVNGRQLEAETELRAGDRIQVGPIVFAVGQQRTEAVPPNRLGPESDDVIASMLLEMDDEGDQVKSPAVATASDTSSDGVRPFCQDTQPDGKLLPSPSSSQTSRSPVPSTSATAAENLLGRYVRRERQ